MLWWGWSVRNIRSRELHIKQSQKISLIPGYGDNEFGCLYNSMKFVEDVVNDRINFNKNFFYYTLGTSKYQQKPMRGMVPRYAMISHSKNNNRKFFLVFI